jgi:hypothetical protein
MADGHSERWLGAIFLNLSVEKHVLPYPSGLSYPINKKQYIAFLDIGF